MLGSLGAGCRKMLPTSVQLSSNHRVLYIILSCHNPTTSVEKSSVYQYAEPTRQKIPAIHQPDLVTSNHPKKSVINPLVEQ